MSCETLTVVKGTNLLLRRKFYEIDGTTVIPPASMAALTVVLSVAGTTYATYVLGSDDECRTDPDDSDGVILEITTTLAATMPEGTLEETWTLKTVDTDYAASDDVRTSTFRVVEVVVL